MTLKFKTAVQIMNNIFETQIDKLKSVQHRTSMLVYL